MAKGHVYKKSSGNWGIDYYFQGRRVREVIGPKKLAEEVLAKRIAQIIEGRHELKRTERIKFNDFVEEFIELHCKHQRSYERGYAVSLKSLKAYFGEKHLNEIDSMLIERYKNFRKSQITKRGTAPSNASVNRELACMKALFNKGIEWGRVKQNPFARVKLFRENNKRTRFLSDQERLRLLEASKPDLQRIILIAINTGMRRSEMQFLKWTAVNFETGNITLTETKNGETRHLPMNKEARNILLQLHAERNSEYVFSSSKGKPYSIRKSFKTALEKAGIQDFHIHDLRHTCASYLAMRGVDLNTIREILGHKSLEMTQRYAHLTETHKRRAIELLDGNLVINQSPSTTNASVDPQIVSVNSLQNVS